MSVYQTYLPPHYTSSQLMVTFPSLILHCDLPSSQFILSPAPLTIQINNQDSPGIPMQSFTPPIPRCHDSLFQSIFMFKIKFSWDLTILLSTCKMTMMTMIISLSFLIGVVLADTLTFTCARCLLTYGDCNRLSGFGFDEMAEYPTTLPCSGGRVIFPFDYTFNCDIETCSGGCQITMKDSGFLTESICAESNAGQLLIKLLNLIYSKSIGDSSLGSELDWCKCGGGLSKGAIAGIVVASIAVLIVVLALISYCCDKRKKEK